jgi:predicted DCC family thiol-disulfide oxidoreductase YuxK
MVQGEGLPCRESLLQSLHLQQADGGMVTGLEANVAVWQHTRFGFLWRVLMLPGIRACAERLYEYWAQQRYKRLYGCLMADTGPQ